MNHRKDDKILIKNVPKDQKHRMIRLDNILKDAYNDVVSIHYVLRLIVRGSLDLILNFLKFIRDNTH